MAASRARALPSPAPPVASSCSQVGPRQAPGRAVARRARSAGISSLARWCHLDPARRGTRQCSAARCSEQHCTLTFPGTGLCGTSALGGRLDGGDDSGDDGAVAGLEVQLGESDVGLCVDRARSSVSLVVKGLFSFWLRIAWRCRWQQLGTAVLVVAC